MTKARIEPDETGEGLWLIVGTGVEAYDCPIAEEEVKPIMEACKRWLKENRGD